MSFRKRNIGLAGSVRGESLCSKSEERPNLPGVRPSPIDGRPTTSTGTVTLDALLAGHSGLPLGCSLLLEENGTTEYSGTLLRFYAAEGLLQGHHVHVVGMPEHWGRELPGVAGESEKKEYPTENNEKMKIAWRYENLGQFGDSSHARERTPRSLGLESPHHESAQPSNVSFCHTFDLTKRLVHPPSAKINFLPVGVDHQQSPFGPVLERLKASLKSSPSVVHRIVIPSILSPALYPPHSCQPTHVLQFMHALRALLASTPNRTTAMASLPSSLYPRSAGLVRWLELLNDGVLELSPFPHSPHRESQNPATAEESPQGLLQIHRLPILHDRGSGNGIADDDWSFILSRKRFTIKAFHLPPVDGGMDAPLTPGGEQKGKKSDVDF